MESSQFFYIKTLFGKISANASAKLSAGVLLSGVEFFFDGNLVTSAIAALFVLVIMDFITAILACYMSKPRIPIESAKILRSGIKLGIYGLMVSAAHLTEVSIGVDAIPLNMIEETMIAFLGLTEFISIMENAGHMGFETPHVLLNRLKEYREAR